MFSGNMRAHRRLVERSQMDVAIAHVLQPACAFARVTSPAVFHRTGVGTDPTCAATVIGRHALPAEPAWQRA